MIGAKQLIGRGGRGRAARATRLSSATLFVLVAAALAACGDASPVARDPLVVETESGLVRGMAQEGVWVYQLDYRDAPFALGAPTLLDPGAFHSAEIPFVFGVPEAAPFRPEEAELSRAIRGLWARFAASGDPGSVSGAPWPRFDEAERHLSFDLSIREAAGVRGGACNFWRGVDRSRMPLL